MPDCEGADRYAVTALLSKSTSGGTWQVVQVAEVEFQRVRAAMSTL